MDFKKVSKARYDKLTKELRKERKSVWALVKPSVKKEIFSYGEKYISFLSDAKTERETVDYIRRFSEEYGFVSLLGKAGPGERIFWRLRGKAAALAVVGNRTLDEGVRIIASHIDAPRLDLKLSPLYEEGDMAYLKTHYYGGIKKFQWVCRPLAIHGVAVKEDGRVVKVAIGEDERDPVFTINDLLPHLAGKSQGSKKLHEAVPGEKLNILFGGLPLLGPKEAKEGVKLMALKLLQDLYGLVEEDLVSAELELVPAGGAREVGLDRAFVGGYGQDDRCCAYAALRAIAETEAPDHTCLALFLDKEEIGSDGNTGAKARFLERILYDLMAGQGAEVSPRRLLHCLDASSALSADVTAGVDPDHPEVHDRRNEALMGYGVCLTKYTGTRGKAGANDAHAEFMARLRGVWNRTGVVWQAGELGKVDEGGGGTVAKYLACLGMDVVDCGPPLLSMHSPFEIAHKGDLFMTYRGYKAFFKG